MKEICLSEYRIFCTKRTESNTFYRLAQFYPLWLLLVTRVQTGDVT